MTGLQFSPIRYNSPNYAATLALRDEVLRKPLGLEFGAAELEQERDHFHIACFRDRTLVGCLMLVPLSASLVKMRQVAVKPQLHGQGIGRTLVEYAEQFARERGFSLMKLHARDTAIPFYEKQGYERDGEMFEEVSIPHWEMQKLLLVV